MNKNKCLIFCLLVAMFLISCGKSVQQRVTEQLELGYRYLEEEKYEEAVVAFEKVIEIDARQVPAYLGEATAYVAMEDYQNAVEVLERGYRQAEDTELESKMAEVCQDAAQYHFDRGEYERAEEYLKRIPEELRDGRYSVLEQEIQARREAEEFSGQLPAEENEEEETSAEQEQTELPEETEIPEEYLTGSHDLKDYADILPEDLGGNLAETLAALLYPENPSFSESDDGMMYVLGDYDMEIGASGNNDGYMVWMYRPVEGFRIYGIEPGMTESDAEEELERQGILPEGGYYMIPEEEAVGSDSYKYLTLVIEDGIVNQVRFAHYLGVVR